MIKARGLKGAVFDTASQHHDNVGLGKRLFDDPSVGESGESSGEIGTRKESGPTLR